MIKVIDSTELKMEVDLNCEYCGRNHKNSKENVDYVFELDTISKKEWCICKECQKKWDKQ